MRARALVLLVLVDHDPGLTALSALGGFFVLRMGEPPHGPPPTLALEAAATGLDEPLELAWRPGDPDTVFVVEQAGRIRVVRDGALQAQPFLVPMPVDEPPDLSAWPEDAALYGRQPDVGDHVMGSAIRPVGVGG